MTLDLIIVDREFTFRTALVGMAQFEKINVVDFHNEIEAYRFLAGQEEVPRAYFVDIGRPTDHPEEMATCLRIHDWAKAHRSTENFYFMVMDIAYVQRYLKPFVDSKVKVICKNKPEELFRVINQLAHP
ncbi:MAG: hypothetical protein AABX04_02270 [Nanoarchaeota archaeon]